MSQDVHLAAISADDCEAIVAVFNHYVEHDFSAFPARPVPPTMFGKLLESAAGYPTVTAKTSDGCLLGFGLLRPHSPFPTLARTAEITYFVAPGETRQGIGSRMLTELERGARLRGIATILAPISSLNDKSLAFHAKHGFVEVGRFREVGLKKDRLFDVVWMQKML
jgi:phosphinothricin acetyltransferase